MNETVKSATQRVREVIHEMGYAVKHPTTGWHRLVQARLREEGVKVNDSLVYKQQRAIAGGGKAKPGKKRLASFHANANGKPDEATPATEPAVKAAGNLFEQAWDRINQSGLTLADFGRLNAVAWKLAGDGQEIDAGYQKLMQVLADLRTLESLKL